MCARHRPHPVIAAWCEQLEGRAVATVEPVFGRAPLGRHYEDRALRLIDRPD
jgi:hypothetical protein